MIVANTGHYFSYRIVELFLIIAIFECLNLCQKHKFLLCLILPSYK